MRDRMSRGPLLALGLSCGLLGSGPAHAQAWIGQVVGDMMAQGAAAQREQACMTGTAMPDSEVAETRPSAAAAMTGYWQAVRGGGGSANVTAFYQAEGKVGWKSGETNLGLPALTRVSDPFAAPGNDMESAPIGYVRSGDGRTVRGQWRVKRADGSTAGIYDALFRRVDGTWKLSQLTLLSPREYAEPVVQFCHKPNDVLPYRLNYTQTMRTMLTKRADRLRAKAVSARSDADRIAGKGDAAATAEARQRADQAEEKARKAAIEAENSVTANEQAKADAAAADAARAAAVAQFGG